MLSWDSFSESPQQSYINLATGEKRRLRKRLQLTHRYTARKLSLSDFRNTDFSFFLIGFSKRSDREAKAVGLIKLRALSNL